MSEISQNPSRFKLTTASVLLDLIRGVASLVVLLEHWRNMLFQDYSQLQSGRPWWAFLYLISAAGHQAVIVFFILSGYLISKSVFRSIENHQWSWGTYLSHRCVRLWVVLIPGLIICAFWDQLGIRLHLAPDLYSGLVPNHETSNVSLTLTLKTFWGNVLFLQTILVPVFGSDKALWSLANEFWYYILFPLGLFLIKKSTSHRRRISSGLLFCVIAWLVKGSILNLFPIWLFGTILARVKRPLVSRNVRNFVLLAYVPITLGLARFHSRFLLLNDYIFALITFMVLWTALSADSIPKPNSLFASFSRQLAAFSYSLYVVHMPFCLFLTALILGDERWMPNAITLSKSLIILGATLLYAYVFAIATEFNTERIRKAIEKRFLLKRLGSTFPQNG